MMLFRLWTNPLAHDVRAILTRGEHNVMKAQVLTNVLQVKSVASSAATTTNWTLAFIVTKFFQDMVNGVGGNISKNNFKHEFFVSEAGAFWIFGGCLAVIFIFCLLFVPETKGKSLEEIQLLFR